MKVESWWPTPIYYSFIQGPVFDQVQTDLETVFQDLKTQDLFQHKSGWNPSSLLLSDTTFLRSLIDDYELSMFRDEIIEHAKKFVAHYGILDAEFKIKQSWMTLTNKGGTAHTHSHGPTDISGVYYFRTSGDDGSIYFESNNKLMGASAMFSTGAHTITYRPEVGKLILFPGFLEHGVYENTTDNERVSVSFNIFVNRY